VTLQASNDDVLSWQASSYSCSFFTSRNTLIEIEGDRESNKRAAPKRLGPYAGIALQLAEWLPMWAHLLSNVLARTDWQPAPTEYTPAVTYRKVVRDNMTWLPVITCQWLSCSVLADDCITCDPAKPLGFSWGCQHCRA